MATVGIKGLKAVFKIIFAVLTICWQDVRMSVGVLHPRLVSKWLTLSMPVELLPQGH